VELTSGALANALVSLSGPHRKVVVLRFYEDMKSETNPKHECAKPKTNRRWRVLGIRVFESEHCFGFRISGLALQPYL
jgi:hypothetical protein